jgi:divalent metal cation (Fe/Co/Zn/Cd) transporter
MITLGAAGSISLHRAFRVRSVAKKYNLISLNLDAKNSIKDGSASVIGFISVVIATQFGFLQMDAIGGMIIGGYIFSVAYVSLKQSSFNLVDAWHNPALADILKKMVEERFGCKAVGVKSVFLRPAGIIAHAEVHIETDGNKKLADVKLLSVHIQTLIRSRFQYVERISIIPHSEFFELAPMPLHNF